MHGSMCIQYVLNRADKSVIYSIRSPARGGRKQANTVRNMPYSGTCVTQKHNVSTGDDESNRQQPCKVSSIWQLPLQFKTACPRTRMRLVLSSGKKGMFVLNVHLAGYALQHLRHDLIIGGCGLPDVVVMRCA
jgi:hypothetical protein